MASPRSIDPMVILAANTPLYAPLLLAKAEATSRACGRLRFRLARPPEFYGSSPDQADPFVEDVLREASSGDHVVIGVGDPMRIAAVPDSYGDQPYVVGSMIRKMCYWAVDRGTRCNERDPLSAKYSAFLVHPLGMTGYSVAYSDEKSLLPPERDEATLTNFLIPQARPGIEHAIYRRSKNWGQRPLAFMTTDPLADDFVGASRDFVRIRAYLDRDAVASAIMTAFLTGRILYDRYAEIIEEVLLGVREAVAMIQHNPVAAAIAVLEKKHQFEFDFAHKWSPQLFVRSLEIIASKDIYETEQGVSRDSWEASRRLRGEVEHLLPHNERWRTLAELNEDFFIARDEPAEGVGDRTIEIGSRDLSGWASSRTSHFVKSLLGKDQEGQGGSASADTHVLFLCLVLNSLAALCLIEVSRRAWPLLKTLSSLSSSDIAISEEVAHVISSEMPIGILGILFSSALPLNMLVEIGKRVPLHQNIISAVLFLGSVFVCGVVYVDRPETVGGCAALLVGLLGLIFRYEKHRLSAEYRRRRKEQRREEREISRLCRKIERKFKPRASLWSRILVVLRLRRPS